MRPLIPSLLILLTLISASAFGKPFNLKKLPAGKQVTLGMPAETLVPVNSKAVLTATESPQTVSFEAKSRKGQSTSKLKIAIWDKTLKKVKYLELGKKKKILYSMKNLGSIVVIPEKADDNKHSKNAPQYEAQLVLKSDKPLRIARMKK